MAIHFSIPSMLQESLIEMILVAKYCVEYKKDQKKWGSPGCYGYPAAILLFSIADSIGSFVLGGNVENHFKILNDPEYYDLGLDDKSIKMIYDNYWNPLHHNTVIPPGYFLDIGTPDSPVFIIKKRGPFRGPFLNLVPFFIVSVKAVQNFLNKAEKIVPNSKQLEDINKKSFKRIK